MSKSLNWRNQTKDKQNFKSKISFLDMAKKKSSFFGKKFSKQFNSPSRNSLKKPVEEKEKRSFNKKIVIEKKGPKSYKDTFGSITSNVKFAKPTKKKQELKENQMYYKFRGHEIIITKEDWSDVKNDYKEKTKHIDKQILENIEKIYITQNNLRFQGTNPMIDDEIILQQYLLMDYCDIQCAYRYFKETNLSLSKFIQTYSLDKLINMKCKDEKAFFKLNKTINKNYNSILKLEKKVNNKQKLNNQEKKKLSNKNEIIFKKLQMNFFKKHFN